MVFGRTSPAWRATTYGSGRAAGSKFLGHRNLTTDHALSERDHPGMRQAVEKLEASRLEPPRYCSRQPLKLEEAVADDGRPRKIGVGRHASWPLRAVRTLQSRPGLQILAKRTSPAYLLVARPKAAESLGVRVSGLFTTCVMFTIS